MSTVFNKKLSKIFFEESGESKLNQIKKSIAFVLKWHPDEEVGGAEIQAWMIAQGLAKRGWEVAYISETHHGQITNTQKNGVRLYRLPPQPQNFSFLNYFALRRVMSSINARVYYQRVVDGYTGLAVQIAKRQGAVSVWASSSLILDCFPSQMQRDWKSRSHLRWKGISFLPAWLTDRIAEYGIRNADQVIAQTQEQKEAIRQTWRRESVVIPNSHPVPESVAEKTGVPIIVWLGSIKSIKQPLLFVDLAKKCSDMDARFVMAGAPVDPALSAELKEQTRDIPNLSYLGPIPFEETNTLLQSAVLLVSTSAGEGFSNTFIQAWLRNVPVVSFVDPDGVIQANGLGECADTFEGLVSSVKKIVLNPDARREMGKQCRDYAVRKHGLDQIMDVYEALFTRLAG